MFNFSFCLNENQKIFDSINTITFLVCFEINQTVLTGLVQWIGCRPAD